MKDDVVWLVFLGTSVEVYANSTDAWDTAMTRIDAYAAQHPQFEDLYRGCDPKRVSRLLAWQGYQFNHDLDAELEVDVIKRVVR